MKKVWVSVILVFSPLLSQENSSGFPLSQELVFLRRVTEFWKDQDFVLAKRQIEEFLLDFPEASIRDYLKSLLGDILYREQEYLDALHLYDQITDPTLKVKTAIRKYQCLYLLEEYDTIISQICTHSDNQKTSSEPFIVEEGDDYRDELNFILADSLFRKTKFLSSDEAVEYARKSQALMLELVEKENYKKKVSLQLAEIHKLLGENKKAADLFKHLAEENPNQKEEFLLHAAFLEASFDLEKAIETYRFISSLGQLKAPEAARNEYILLMQSHQFHQIIERAPQIAPFIQEEKDGIFQFCMGWSEFQLKNYQTAAHHLKKFIEMTESFLPQRKSAFTTLFSCAQKIDDETTMRETVEALLTEFSQEKETAQALLAYTQQELENKKQETAKWGLDQFTIFFPNHNEKKNLTYNYGLLLLENQKWTESRVVFSSLIQENPEFFPGKVWPCLLNTAIEELKETPEEKQAQQKNQVIEWLETALSQNQWDNSLDPQHYHFLLGQLLFEAKRYPETLNCFETFCLNYPEHENIPLIKLLQTQLHVQLGTPHELVIPLAQKALSMNQQPDHQAQIHLHLFNAYLALNEYESAADHLYQSSLTAQKSIQRSNLLWLVNYYYEKGKVGHQEHEKRARLLLSKLLKINEDGKIGFRPEESYLEVETLKFSVFLEQVDRKNLLLSLIDLQSNHPNQPWKLRKQALLELGKTHLELDEPEQALRIFELLIAEASPSSYEAQAALLEKSRLFVTLNYNRLQSNPIIPQLLSDLKDLQVQKKFSTEPIHLEAAIQYADVRTLLAPEESRLEAAIFFLNRVKQYFTQEDDLVSQKYHEERVLNPEKEELFQTYMKCIEAEISFFEFKLKEKEGNLKEGSSIKDKTVSLLSEIYTQENCTPYLKNRIENKLTALKGPS